MHLHYTDLWETVYSFLRNFENIKYDLYITVTDCSDNVINKILEKMPRANIQLVENRGRDILPFIKILKLITPLNYELICKIHSKKSKYRNDGNIIRNELLSSLLGSTNIIQNIIEEFKNKKIGLITAEKYLLSHTNHNMTYDQHLIKSVSSLLNINFYYFYFPAGSCFWFKPSALVNLTNINDHIFEFEEGYADGTTAHCIERLFCIIAKENGYISKGI